MAGGTAIAIVLGRRLRRREGDPLLMYLTN